MGPLEQVASHAREQLFWNLEPVLGWDAAWSAAKQRHPITPGDEAAIERSHALLRRAPMIEPPH